MLVAPLLIGRAIGEIGAIALAGIDDRAAGTPGRSDQVAHRRNDRAQGRSIVTLPREIALLREEIDLQIDDQQRRRRRLELAVIGIVEWSRFDHVSYPFAIWPPWHPS